MFKLLARIFRTLDNFVSIFENTSKAAAITSESTIIMANNFNQVQTAKLEAQTKANTEAIAKGEYDNL